MEQPNEILATNNERTLPNVEYSRWGLFLFGPFYLAYKGFLKESTLILFSTLCLNTLIVDFIIEPESDKNHYVASQIISSLINFLLALKWEDYVNRWNKKSKPNLMPKWINLIIFVFSFSSLFMGIIYIEDLYLDRLLAEAIEFEKNDKTSEALDIHLKLCRKDKGIACEKVGDLVADIKNEKGRKYWNKACNLDEGGACYKLGQFWTDQANPGNAKRFYEKACKLDVKDACSR